MFALTLTVVGSAYMQAPAQASNFGPCYGNTSGTEPCTANNSTHYFAYSSSIVQSWRDAIEWSRVNTWDTTDLTTSVASPGSADIYNYVYNGDDTVWGRYTCDSLLKDGVCASASTYFNDSINAFYGGNPGSLTTGQKRAVACHETGHSLGLRHPAQNNASLFGCLVTYQPADLPQLLGAHGAAHINTWY